VENNFKRVAVISGIGTRNYYRKLGYRLDEGDGQFMIKEKGQKQSFAFIMMGMVVVLASVVMSKII